MCTRFFINRKRCTRIPKHDDYRHACIHYSFECLQKERPNDETITLGELHAEIVELAKECTKYKADIQSKGKCKLCVKEEQGSGKKKQDQ
jgi:hypothetical protein